MSEKISALEDHLGYWLRYVSNHVSQAFSHRLAGYDVSFPEWVVLRELFDAPQAPSALAEKLGMTRGAITKLADRLIAKSLIVRTANETDGRAQILALTRPGRTLTPKLAKLADENDASFFAHLKPGERAALARLLTDIVRRQGMRAIPID